MTSGDQTCHGISLFSSLSMDRSFLSSETGSNILSASSSQPQVHGSKPTGAAGTSWCRQTDLGRTTEGAAPEGDRGCPSCHKLLTGMASAGLRVPSTAGGLLCHRGGTNVETPQTDFGAPGKDFAWMQRQILLFLKQTYLWAPIALRALKLQPLQRCSKQASGAVSAEPGFNINFIPSRK